MARANTPHTVHPSLGHWPATSPAAQGLQPRRLAWLLALAFACAVPTVAAQPSNPTPVAGQATWAQTGSHLLVTTQNAPGTQHSAINWQSFNLPAGSSAWFQQPNANSTSINRVMDAKPSVILGSLGSNGHLVLVNPAGIAVGAGAVVDTARFTAAAMQMSDADALAGRLRFEGGGQVQVQGQVLARDSDVLLLAPDVQVAAGALVQAPNGAVLLAAGQKIEVIALGLEGLRFEIQAPTDQAVNLGALQGNALGMFASQLRHSGHINVEAVQTDGGKIVIRAKDQATLDGAVRVQGLNGLGGQLHATAQRVDLTAMTVIDARGEAGGGEVLIGGGWQGLDARLPNAQTTVVAREAAIEASATVQGAGGTVVVWADEHATFQGHINARGGTLGGAGGQVQTAGLQGLTLGGQVDTRAAQGPTGDWLIKLPQLTVQGGDTPTRPLANTLYEAELESVTSNLRIQADTHIALAGSFTDNAIHLPGIHLALQTTGTSSGGIHLLLPNSLPTPIALETSGSGSLSLQTATHHGIQTGNLVTAGGNIRVQAGGPLDLQQATLKSNGGNIHLEGGGTGLSAGAGVYIHNGARIDAATGAVTISGTSDTEAGVKISNSDAASSDLLEIRGRTVKITGRTATGDTGVHLETAALRASEAVSVQALGGELLLSASQVQNTGSGLTRLGASGVADAAVTLDADSQLGNLGGKSDILLEANAVQINGTVDAGSQARVIIKPSDTGRAMALGGTDTPGQLNLTADEIARIKAQTLVLGSSAHTGGLVIESPVALPAAQVQALSLLQNASASVSQKLGASLQVERLNADAGFVNLPENNQVLFASGRAWGDNGFKLTSAAPSLTLSTVDGIQGVAAGSAGKPAPIHIQLTTPGASLAQDSSAPLLGSHITLAGLGGEATLSDVQAQGTLSLSGWKSVLLNGKTQFDALSFPGGSLATSSSAVLVPGGDGRKVQAAEDNVLRTFVTLVAQVLEEEQAAVGGTAVAQTPEERRRQDADGLVGEAAEDCP